MLLLFATVTFVCICVSVYGFLCQRSIYIILYLSASSLCLSLHVVCVHISLSRRVRVCVCVSGHLFSVESGLDSQGFVFLSLCSGIKKTEMYHNSVSDVLSPIHTVY